MVQPRYRERSRTGAHGEDVYVLQDLLSRNVAALVRIRISNSGKHYCSLAIGKNLSPIEKAKILTYVTNYIHDCPGMLESIEEIDIAEYLKSIAR